MRKLLLAAALVLSVSTAQAQSILFPPQTALTKGSTSALATALVLKNKPGYLYSFDVSADATLSGAAWWLMMFDATATPADGAVTPDKCYAVPSGTTFYAAAFPWPINFTKGIVLAVSTTGCFTKTSSTHAYISGDYQ